METAKGPKATDSPLQNSRLHRKAERGLSMARAMLSERVGRRGPIGPRLPLTITTHACIERFLVETRKIIIMFCCVTALMEMKYIYATYTTFENENIFRRHLNTCQVYVRYVLANIYKIYVKYILNIQLLKKIYFIHFDIYLTYIFFPCGGLSMTSLFSSGVRGPAYCNEFENSREMIFCKLLRVLDRQIFWLARIKERKKKFTRTM